MSSELSLTVIVPCYNESLNIEAFYKQLKETLNSLPLAASILYVNDGSRDNTLELINQLASHDSSVYYLDLSRNFGKEAATSAGIDSAEGDAVVIIDGDGQHPPELITRFVEEWQNGADIVVGIRKANQKEGTIKKYGSKLFYALMNKLTRAPLTPGLTDYCLLDKSVKSDFSLLTERNRITRGLIDWLGYKRVNIEFVAKPRMAGEASYKFSGLFTLALNSFISLSLKPLYFAFYLGLFLLPSSIILGVFSIIETLIGDPLNLNITGTAYLVILCIFMLGLLLVSQGIMALYLSHIHTETQNRPLYLVNKRTSKIQ